MGKLLKTIIIGTGAFILCALFVATLIFVGRWVDQSDTHYFVSLAGIFWITCVILVGISLKD